MQFEYLLETDQELVNDWINRDNIDRMGALHDDPLVDCGKYQFDID